MYLLRTTYQKQKLHICAAAALTCVSLSFPASVQAAPGYEDTAKWDETSDYTSIISYGMTPITGSLVEDGEYEVNVISSSSYFRLDHAILHVEDGEMTAEIYFDSLAYEYVYSGSPEEAAADDFENYIPCEDTGLETVFTFPVKALNQPLSCAAYSKKRDKWYGRMIMIDAAELPSDSIDAVLPDYEVIAAALETAGYDAETMLSASIDGIDDSEDAPIVYESVNTAEPENAKAHEYIGEPLSDETAVSIDLADGEYSIEADMSGGSGRATISSPMLLTVSEGRAYATVNWSSKYYDYMIVNGQTYYNESAEGVTSSFTIPILAMDEPFQVIADTTAMDDPVEIEYSLIFYQDSIGSKSMIPQEAAKRVIIAALIVIVLGAVINHFVQKRRYK